VTGDEEEDAVVAVLYASSIASSGTFLAAGQSFWNHLLGSRLTMSTGQRRGGGAGPRLRFWSRSLQRKMRRRGGGGAAPREDKKGRLGFRWDQKIRGRGITRLAWERQ
jgi:hypothetical protein